MNHQTNKTRSYPWNVFVKNINSTEEFIYPFYQILDNVFADIISVIIELNISFISNQSIASLIFHDLGGRITMISKFIFMNEFELFIKEDMSLIKFSNFIDHISRPCYLMRLYSIYPALKNKINLQVELFVHFYQIVIKNLKIDYEALSTSFFQNNDMLLMNITRVGDIHEKGRCVCLLEFCSVDKDYNRKVIYKPKNLLPDIIYNETLSWAYNKLNIKFKLPKFLFRPLFGWMEFVEAGVFNDPSDIENYFFKFGVVSVISYLFLGKDLHAHNIIASRDGPVIIDMECMLSPCIVGLSKTDKFLLINTMLFPQKRNVTSDYSGIDISALSSIKNKKHSQKKYIFINDGTDNLALIKTRRGILPAYNLPQIEGEDVNCVKYRKYLEDGFEIGYELISTNKNWLISSKSSPVSRLSNITGRVVLRNTSEYDHIIQESYKVEYMKCETSLANYLKSIKLAFNHVQIDEILNYEMSFLARGVIPTFWIKGKSQCVWGYNCKLNFELIDLPFNEFKAHLNRIGPTDFRVQFNLLQQSVFCYQKNTCYNNVKKNDFSNIGIVPINREKVIQLKTQQLFDLLCIEGNKFYWFDIKKIKNTYQIDKAKNCFPVGNFGTLVIIALIAYKLHIYNIIERIRAIYPYVLISLKAECNAHVSGVNGFSGMLYATNLLAKILKQPCPLNEHYYILQRKLEHVSDISYSRGLTGLIASVVNSEGDCWKKFLEDALKLLEHKVCRIEHSKDAPCLDFFNGITAPIYLLNKAGNNLAIYKRIQKLLLHNHNNLILEKALFLDDDTDLPSIQKKIIFNELERISQKSAPVFSDLLLLWMAHERHSVKKITSLKEKFIERNIIVLDRYTGCLSPGFFNGLSGILYSLVKLELDLEMDCHTILGIDKAFLRVI